MGWTQKVEYINVESIARPPVKKQVWDGEKFVPTTWYKHTGLPSNEKLEWLKKTYGPAGVNKKGLYWNYSVAGNFIVMDEQINMWFQTKWSNV